MNSGLEKKGRIFNIQKYSIYDGQGIRTLVFLKGCNMRCDWCSNPEGLEYAYQVMYSQENCTQCGKCSDVCPVGIHRMVSNDRGVTEHHLNRNIECIGCKKCEEVCFSDALEIVGKEITVQEVMDIVMQDYSFYLASDGGVTLGGGEMSTQIDFAEEILKQCKKMMLNTAVETNGTTALSNYERLAKYTDLFLFDIKHIDTQQHQKLFGFGNEGVKRNLQRLIELGANIVIRMPIIKGYNDSYDAITGAIHYVMQLADNSNIKRIEFLPYHQFGKTKYEKLGMIYPVKHDPSYSNEELDKLSAFFNTFNFDIRLVKH